METRLAAARYGKDNVRLCKVHREQSGDHTVAEMTICVLLEGEIDTSYTKADNSVVIATDSMKNTIFILAKLHPVSPPELFASIIGTHFINTYRHIHVAHVSITTHRWTRIPVNGKPHRHSFLRDGGETRNVEADVIRGRGIEIKSGISGLLVLKTTDSQFYGFVRDEFTTLPETRDRILSTEIDAKWRWSLFAGLDQVKSEIPKFDAVWDAAREISLNTFAKDNSASVQNTMYKMAEQILASESLLTSVDLSLPNKHYFELDLSWHHGIKNTDKDAEVYVPQSGPNGLIKCTVARAEGPMDKFKL